MDYRKDCGEEILGDSWVMRDMWQTYGMDYGAKFGLAAEPKKLESIAVKRIIERGLWEQGLRKPLPKGIKHHEWKAAHGFRKYFKTKAEQVMLPLHVEMLLGHDTGLSMNYYRPSEKTLLADYLKAVDLLSINYHEQILRKQVANLTAQTQNNEYIIRAKLQEKDDALVILSDQVMKLMAEVQELKQKK
jgi:hypothetical protein